MTSKKSVLARICLPLCLIAQVMMSSAVNATPAIAPIADQNNNETQAVSITAIGSTDTAGASISYSATGLPGGVSINATTGVISGTLTYTSSGVRNVTVTVTENNDPLLTASTSFTWTITDVNRIPYTVTQPAITVNENVRNRVILVFADNDNDTLTVSNSQLPPFTQLSISSSTAGRLDVSLLSLPGFNDAGVYQIVVTVTDSKGGSVSNNVQMTVVNVNRAPQITNPGAQVNQAGTNASLQIAASDVDQDPLTFSATNLPEGLAINPSSGLISGTIATTANPAYSSTVIVSDGVAQAQAVFDWTITSAAPTVSIVSPGDQVSSENDAINLQISANASNGGALTYAANGLPDPLAINANGVITGTLGYNSSGDYPVSVTVSLQSDPTISDTLNFNWHVNNTNRVPVANAGPDSNIVTNETVMLDGSSSSDPDGDMLAFSWHVVAVPAGSTVNDASLIGSTTPQVSFAPDVDGSYQLDLEVNDSQLTAIDTVIITAATPPNVAPNANAGNDLTVEVNTQASLDGTNSNDPDNYPQALTYRWYFAARPANSNLSDANIANANTEQADFVPDVTGVYMLTLEVSDGRDLATDQVQVTATYTNIPPVANAGPDQSITLGSAALLDGSASVDTDNYPATMTYAWSVISVPAGSAIDSTAIVNANAPAASILPDVAGTYLLRLDVSDGEASAFDQMTVTVQAVGQVPAAPGWVKSKFNKRGVYLLWKASTGADNYVVYRKTSNDTDFVAIGTTVENRFRDELPYGVNGADYYVVAKNQYGMSEPSMTISTSKPSYRRNKH